MIVDRRRVDRLSLEVGRREDVSRAATTIREALRIATMPGDGRPGRLFIRRLDLGVIRLDAGPSPIARWLESYVRSLRGSAVAMSDPRAPLADVVLARDPIEPLVLALAEAARGRRLDAWYWPQVDPAFTASRTPAQIAALVWTQLGEARHAPGILARVVEAVLDGPNAVEVLRVIDPILGQRLSHGLGLAPAPAALAPVLIETLVPARWRGAVRATCAAWSDERRVAWLVTVAIAAAHPRLSEAGLSRLIRRAASLASPPPAPAPAEDAPETPAPALVRPRPAPDQPVVAAGRASADAGLTAEPDAPGPGPAPAPPERHGAPAKAEPGPIPAPLPPRAQPQPSDASEPAPTRHPASTRWSLIARPQPTGHGGLYFLLRPLARLGLDAFLAAHPELDGADLGVRVLARIADLLEVEPDDPIRVALVRSPAPPPARVPAGPGFDELWTPAHPRPQLDARELDQGEGSEEGVELEVLVERWAAAVGAWLERHAELELAAVVTREAAVLCSRTHLDLIFDMEASDIEIRKAALDIDPGWVPWLGRVVQFHYVHGGLLDD